MCVYFKVYTPTFQPPFTKESCTNWTYDKSVLTRTLVTDLDLVCNGGRVWVDFISETCMFMGMLGGSFIGSWLSDNYGRRRTVVWSMGLSSLLFFAESFLNDVYSYSVFRVVSCAFSYVVLITSSTLLVEVVSHQYRYNAMAWKQIGNLQNLRSSFTETS